MIYGKRLVIELLQSLTVKNFAIINNLSIDFDKGFTAITGETEQESLYLLMQSAYYLVIAHQLVW